MGNILNIIAEKSGGTCYQTDRFTLDHFVPPEYQDNDEVFSKVFETDNNSQKNILLSLDETVPSLFKYFLDGSRRTYKVGDFGSTDGKFLPLVAGQIGAAVCYRHNKTLKKHKILRQNVLAIPDRIGDEFEKIAAEIPKISKKNLSIHQVLKYTVKPNRERSLEDIAIAKIQVTMMNMEIDLIKEMVHSNHLDTNKMLMIDGPLQFRNITAEDAIFGNVVGVSKSFNPNLPGILKTKRKEIGSYLTKLQFKERTPVYLYEIEGQKNKTRSKIGAWYMRIHQQNKLKKPLDGVIKIEKIATTRQQKDDGFDTEMINNISRAILRERNVTCYGNDDRWANHLYPIYLTELFLKNSFVSDTFFLNIF